MFSPKVITLFIVSMMMTSTAVVARPEPTRLTIPLRRFHRLSSPDKCNAATILTVATETVVQASTVAQMDSVENVPEDNSKTVHATSVTRSMGLAMIMAAWVSIKFAPLERSKDVLVTDLIGWKLGKGPPKESAAPYIRWSFTSIFQ
ncbi:hypothetical protein L218DRAFT_949929 [Marasmius fiardii PR-910]|nr:hypothetical protein L218DRAFT_949929 [Marasmius fiardii PR-910]